MRAPSLAGALADGLDRLCRFLGRQADPAAAPAAPAAAAAAAATASCRPPRGGCRRWRAAAWPACRRLQQEERQRVPTRGNITCRLMRMALPFHVKACNAMHAWYPLGAAGEQGRALRQRAQHGRRSASRACCSPATTRNSAQGMPCSLGYPSLRAADTCARPSHVHICTHAHKHTRTHARVRACKQARAPRSQPPPPRSPSALRLSGPS